MAYTNSSLVKAQYLSPNHYNGRTSILGVVPHCYVGYASMASCGSWFSNSNSNASCNYYIDASGNVALIVPEKYAAWTTSSYTCDMNHVTIECASASTSPYQMTDATYNTLIKLTADIYKRNGITKCYWEATKAHDSVKGYIPMHRNYKNKACPGDWLVAKYKSGDFQNKVNAILSGQSADSVVGTTSSTSSTASDVNVTYAVKTKAGRVLPAVTNLNDYAGLEGQPIVDFTAKVSKGSIKYRSYRQDGTVGPWISNSDFTFKNTANYSGNDKSPITAIEAVYYTPSGMSYKYLYTRVSTIKSSAYYDWQKDNQTSGGQDGFAGDKKNAIDKVQMYVK